jgi:NitT/TauT family transport system substrate-binding protein
VLADTRTLEGLRAVFQVDDYPASCLLARREWLDSHQDTAKRMAQAVLRSLAWIREHSAEEVLARIPAESRTGDAASEIAAIRLAQPIYSVDGRINKESAEAVLAILGLNLPKSAVLGTFVNP